MLSTVEKRYSAGELGGIWRSSPFFFLLSVEGFWGSMGVLPIYARTRESTGGVVAARSGGSSSSLSKKLDPTDERSLLCQYEVVCIHTTEYAYSTSSMHTLLVGVCICIVGGAFILSTSYTVGSFISVLHTLLE